MNISFGTQWTRRVAPLDSANDTPTLPTLPENTDPLLRDAVRKNSASFEQLTQVFYAMHTDETSSESRALCPHILQAFQAEHGAIVRMDVRPDLRAAVALTARGKLHVDYLLGQCPQIDPCLIECHHLTVEAERLLEGKVRRDCLEMLYAVMKNLFWLVDRFHSDEAETVTEQHAATIDMVKQRLQMAKKYHAAAAQLRAQKYYLIGAFCGSLFLALLIAFLSTSRILLPPFSLSTVTVAFFGPAGLMPHLESILASSLICGGAGAIISVMMRMNAGNLLLNYEADRWLLAVTGFFRPLVGAIFAVVIVALVQSSFSPIPAGGGEVERTLTFYVIGFLAGFSERFAPDMLDITGKEVLPLSDGNAEPPGSTKV